MIFVTVFTFTFQVNVRPTWVFHLMRRFTNKYGTNLDTRAPKAVRTTAYRVLRMHRLGIPQTPIP